MGGVESWGWGWVERLGEMVDAGCSGLYNQVIYLDGAAKRCNKWHLHRVLILLSKLYPHNVRPCSVE